MFLAYLWGIETRHNIPWFKYPVPFLAYLWGIETDGKERKVNVGGEVFSLPMRNWNSFIGYTPFRSTSAFLAYLWGIETLVSLGKAARENAGF